MAESQIKKSTIMFTDIFGYSRMVGRDEKHALKLLDEHNNIITAAIDAHNGSVIKFIGDAIFMLILCLLIQKMVILLFNQVHPVLMRGYLI